MNSATGFVKYEIEGYWNVSDCEFYNCFKFLRGALIAQLGERQTLDRKVASSILTQGTVLCP